MLVFLSGDGIKRLNYFFHPTGKSSQKKERFNTQNIEY